MISELKTQLKNQQDLKIEEISQKSAEMNQNNFEFVHLSNIESQEVRELVEQHNKPIPLFI